MIRATDHLSLILVAADDEDAEAFEQWLDENVAEVSVRFGASIAVEPRYAADFIYRLELDGFEVELGGILRYAR